MSAARQFRAIKGVRDILPPESAAWNRVEQTAREVFEAYGYGEIRLPIFEETELFARSIGKGTDVISKEMFTFIDNPFGRLDEANKRLVEEVIDFQNAAQREAYISRFSSLVDRAESMWNTGEIEQTRKREDALNSLKSARDDLKIKPTPETAWANYFSAVLLQTWGGVFGDSLSLRPEATASVCRAYIEHGMQTRPGNVKLYYIGPMFRRERPQKGRYRQFYQIGAEVLTPSPSKEETAQERVASAAVDAEVIEMLLHFFARIGLSEAADGTQERKPQGRLEAGGTVAAGAATEGITLYYNSIGCRECRPKYVAELKAALEKVREQLGPDSQRRIETNPLRVLDSKVEREQPVIEKLPRIGEHLCAACREHFAALEQQFALRGIEGVENWRLVRGLDYYTRTTFEITAPGLGAQNAVCGGGRYDGLVELLGGPPTKGIGFAIGTDRVMLSLEQQGRLAAAAGCDVYVAWMGAASQSHAIRLARKLREAGFAAEVPAEEMKFRKSLDLANRLGARYALIIGENEIAAGRYALKRLADASQRELTEGELLEFLSGERRVAVTSDQ